MSSPLHEVYSRCLFEAGFGHPLWTPQLKTELPQSYQLGGLKIGDVGIVSPNNGSFDVLFNITLGREDQPYPELVQEDFTPVIVNQQRDLDTHSRAMPAHDVISSASVVLVSREFQSCDQEPSRADYRFSLFTEDGAVLILPEGADSCDLTNEQRFLQEAIRYGVDWYECATSPQRAGRFVNGSLYLVTGFHKARSWSLGAAGRSDSSLQTPRSVKFTVGEMRQGGITARAYLWEIALGFRGRVGPESPYPIPDDIRDERRYGVNQTVFVRGFRIMINKLLFFKTVSVKTRQGTFGGFGTYVNNILWRKPSESTQSSDVEHATDNAEDQDFSGNYARLYTDTRLTIDRVPDVSQTFHPGDLINRYLLKKEPHAMLALTHDNLWIEMLRRGMIKLTEFSHEKRLEEVVSKNYRLTVEDGAVYLQRDISLESPPHEHSSVPVPTRATATSMSHSETQEGISSQTRSYIVVDDATLDLSTPSPCVDPSFKESDIEIDAAVLDSWKNDQLENADALLTTAITKSENPIHHLFASRALVRARLRKWDAALADAEMAINIQPSVIGFIAKSVAHVGKGERHKGYQTCDTAFEHFHSSHGNFLLLIKAIVVFMAGEHRDAISRVDDLIAMIPFNSVCCMVQAYMYLYLGKLQMESGDHEGAIESFACARAPERDYPGSPLFAISLITGWKFDHLNITIRQQLCEALYAAGRTNDAAQCFHQLKTELGGNGNHLEWAHAFGQRPERLGDTAMDALRYGEAISHYTTALYLFSSPLQAILIKRSKAWLAAGSWKQALDDANKVIALDPSSPWGYEIKHASLHKGGNYDDAADAFETMLMKMAESPDPDVQQRGDRYISPWSTRVTIRKIVHRTLCHSPRVLINTTTGHLYNRAEQASAFESLPIFKELVSSTTTRIDYVHIKREVREYFRYVMLSHTWEDNEPLFEQVVHMAVYDLEESPTHDKLQTFCKIVRDAGFDWAWSDTCCIDKSDHFVLQEALVAMFKWYQGSAMMIVFLRGVHPSSPRGALAESIWNTRAWTLQEYIAARVVRFYTEDWTLYRDLNLSNHKESPEVISEMEEATKMPAQQLMALRPGLTSIREKLYLASIRKATLVEDAAYSLLGIFSASLPVVYGEGDQSLGRLLAYALAVSGDASILAWTGESGSFNSCLPAHITVFSEPATSHLVPPISDAKMERRITASHSSPFDLGSALRLYERLNDLSPPCFIGQQLRLPCIAFQLPLLTHYQTGSGRVYRADTVAFGVVEIKTRQDLSRTGTLYLVHPWLGTVLDREDVHGSAVIEDHTASPSPLPDGEEIDDEETDNEDEETDDEDEETDNDDEETDDDASSLVEPELPSHPAPLRTTSMDEETRARRFVARLRQPFGALLVTHASTGRRAMDYRRVAADSLITVQFQKDISLAYILDSVRVLDVL